jgi:hypothetical protein
MYCVDSDVCILVLYHVRYFAKAIIIFNNVNGYESYIYGTNSRVVSNTK